MTDFTPSHTEQRFYALDSLRLARRIIAQGARDAQTDKVRKAVAEILADLDEKIAQFDGTEDERVGHSQECVRADPGTPCSCGWSALVDGPDAGFGTAVRFFLGEGTRIDAPESPPGGP